MEQAPFDIGEPVVDRDSESDDPNTAIIVNCPPRIANDWTAYRDTTVAEDNPDYPEDAPVAVAVYRDELAEFDSNWDDHDTPFLLSDLNEAGVSYYSFPVPRLRSIEQSETESEQREKGEKRWQGKKNEQNGQITYGEPSTDSRDSAKASTNEESVVDDENGSGLQNEVESEPSDALVTLKEALADRGVGAEIDTDEETVIAEKLGVTYRVKSEGVIDGDGPHREQIEQIATETVGEQ